MRTFEFTDEHFVAPGGEVLHRIRAIVDIPSQKVKKGDLGGFVGPHAQVLDQAWVFDHALVYGLARLSGCARVEEHARVYGEAWMSDVARAFGGAEVCGNVWVNGNARVGEGARVSDDSDILTAEIHTSIPLSCTLTRVEGGGWRVRVGCWWGTVPQLRVLAESDEWVETTGDEIVEARPELLAFVGLCEARIRRTSNA